MNWPFFFFFQVYLFFIFFSRLIFHCVLELASIFFFHSNHAKISNSLPRIEKSILITIFRSCCFSYNNSTNVWHKKIPLSCWFDLIWKSKSLWNKVTLNCVTLKKASSYNESYLNSFQDSSKKISRSDRVRILFPFSNEILRQMSKVSSQ